MFKNVLRILIVLLSFGTLQQGVTQMVFQDSFEKQLLPPEQLFVRSADEKQLTVSWAKVENANYYRIYIATKDFTELVSPTKERLQQFARDHEGDYFGSWYQAKTLYDLKKYTRYYIVVTAENDELVSLPSKTLATNLAIPAPMFIKGKSYGMGSATIDWKAVPEATHYTVYFSDTPFVFESDSDKHTEALKTHIENTQGQIFTPINDTSHTVSNLTITQPYYFVVTANKDDIEGYADKNRNVVIRGGLNDTGVTVAEPTSSNNSEDCVTNILGQQDCHYGRDKTDNDNNNGVAGFDFIKLDTDGKPLTADATNWVCVLDKTTGLIWEVKDYYNKNTVYTHYDERFGGDNDLSDNANDGGDDGVWAGPSRYSSTTSYINNANNQAICGLKDWRLPTREELRSLVYYGQKTKDSNGHRILIDLDYFPHTQANDYWTSTPVSGNHRNNWVIYFGNGMSTERSKENKRRVRLVYGNQ